MKVIIFFALVCLAIASATLVAPLGSVAVSSIGVPLGSAPVVVGGSGLVAPGIVGVGGVRVVG